MFPIIKKKIENEIQIVHIFNFLKKRQLANPFISFLAFLLSFRSKFFS